MRHTEPFNSTGLFYGASQAAAVKSPPAVRELLEAWLPSLGREDTTEEGVATHSSILSLKNPVNRGAWRATVHRILQRAGHN